MKFLIFVLLSLTSFPSESFAWQCAPVEPKAQLETAKYIFSFKILNSDETSIVVQPIEIFKGDLPNRVKLKSQKLFSVDLSRLDKKSVYLIAVATNDASPKPAELFVFPCWLLDPLSKHRDLIQWYKSNVAPDISSKGKLDDDQHFILGNLSVGKSTPKEVEVTLGPAIDLGNPQFNLLPSEDNGSNIVCYQATFEKKNHEINFTRRGLNPFVGEVFISNEQPVRSECAKLKDFSVLQSKSGLKLGISKRRAIELLGKASNNCLSRCIWSDGEGKSYPRVQIEITFNNNQASFIKFTRKP